MSGGNRPPHPLLITVACVAGWLVGWPASPACLCPTISPEQLCSSVTGGSPFLNPSGRPGRSVTPSGV